MKEIKDLLSGKYDVTDFMKQAMTDENLHKQIQALIPKEAIHTPNHPFWGRGMMRSALECYDFDIRAMLFSHCGYGETDADRLEIFNTIRELYLREHPNQRCTRKYEDCMFFYLELEQNCFGGPEVIDLVKAIASDTAHISPKSLRKKEGKNQVYALFHVTDRNLPRWLHGPEWPMGTKSPMKFLSQKRTGEIVQFTFMDTDTKEIRVITQRY